MTTSTGEAGSPAARTGHDESTGKPSSSFPRWRGRAPVLGAACARLLVAMGAGWLFNVAAHATGDAQVDGTIGIDTTDASTDRVGADFIGTSFGVQQLTGGDNFNYYGFQYTTDNADLYSLYAQIGIRQIRLSYDVFEPTDGSVPNPEPTAQQIDSFFDFCSKAGVQSVIWSLPLRFSDGAEDPNWDYRHVAQYIWTTDTPNGTNMRSMLEGFAFDNEPDIQNKWGGGTLDEQYTAYFNAWTDEAKAVDAFVGTDCTFVGPDTYAVGQYYDGHTDGGVNGTLSDGNSWDVQFATDVVKGGFILSGVDQHCYVGYPGYTTTDNGQSTDGGGPGISLTNDPTPWNSDGWANFLLENDWAEQTNTGDATDGLLWQIDNTVHAPLTTNPAFSKPNIMTDGFRYTESEFEADANPLNQIFGTALAYLDFLHLAARHNVAGVDAMGAVKSYNSPVYVENITDGTYTAEPIAYAQKMFLMGSYNGYALYSGNMSDGGSYPGLTSYGVVNGSHLYVTVINKTCSQTSDATDYHLTFNLKDFAATYVHITTLEQAPGATDNPGGYGADISGGILTDEGVIDTGTDGHSVTTDGQGGASDPNEVVYSATARVFDFSYTDN